MLSISEVFKKKPSNDGVTIVLLLIHVPSEGHYSLFNGFVDDPQPLSGLLPEEVFEEHYGTGATQEVLYIHAPSDGEDGDVHLYYPGLEDWKRDKVLRLIMNSSLAEHEVHSRASLG